MFQGSASLGKRELARSSPPPAACSTARPGSTTRLLRDAAVQRPRPGSSWGRPDTARPAVTEESLRQPDRGGQGGVRVNVLNEPYGGFPWLTLPPVLYDSWSNAHDGYGSFVDLESATLDDARGCFDKYYAPGNAVLAVSGDFDVDQALEPVHHHFDSVPKRAVPPRPDFDEPAPTSERRGEQRDEAAPAPAVALGWQVPDPADLSRLPAVRRPLGRPRHPATPRACDAGWCRTTGSPPIVAAASA